MNFCHINHQTSLKIINDQRISVAVPNLLSKKGPFRRTRRDERRGDDAMSFWAMFFRYWTGKW
jgi:hypothetical protein